MTNNVFLGFVLFGMFGYVLVEVSERQFICANNVCGLYSYSYISSRWPGIFFTKEELEEKLVAFSSLRRKYLNKQGVNNVTSGRYGDGDSCCETKISQYINFTMQNFKGQTKYIVHMPPKFQFIPHGECVSQGMCRGLCVLEPITHTLLTFDLGTGLQFDQFVVPGYCSCKESKPAFM